MLRTKIWHCTFISTFANTHWYKPFDISSWLSCCWHICRCWWKRARNSSVL